MSTHRFRTLVCAQAKLSVDFYKKWDQRFRDAELSLRNRALKLEMVAKVFIASVTTSLILASCTPESRAQLLREFRETTTTPPTLRKWKRLVLISLVVAPSRISCRMAYRRLLR